MKPLLYINGLEASLLNV